MSNEVRDDLIERLATRFSGVLFDILSSRNPPEPTAARTCAPWWCTCQKCREMPTDVEKKCCQQRPEHYISITAHMELFCLEPGILRLARGLRREYLGLDDLKDPGQDDREFRHAAYRQFVLWQHGRLRAGHHVVVPSCCVWRIRDAFPDPNSNYTGFITGLL